MKKAIVTGGLGFIGSNLIKLLLKKNYKMINLDKISYSSNFYNTNDFKNNKIYNIVEKPKKFVSDYAITGLYFFDNKAVKFTKMLKKSNRGELEIVDLLNMYKKNDVLKGEIIGRGAARLDTGTIEDFYKASSFVENIEKRQGFKIACIEEIALKNKWINKKKILNAIKFYGKSEYSEYLKSLI